jgi:hypothetical protein
MLSTIVAAQETGKNAVVSPVYMNILYRGFANPVEIAVPGIASENVTAQVTNGTIRKISAGWEVLPGDQNESVITVLVNNKKVSEKIFRVKNVPNPIAVFAEKYDGHISKDVALNTELLEVELKDFGWDLKFVIKSFTFSCSNEKSDPGLLADGNKITDKMKALIAGCKTGQNIIFKDIKALGPDGRPRDLNQIVLTII